MRLASLSMILIALTASSARAQSIDTSIAIGALRDFDEACRRDGGKTWRRSLCGPIALVEPTTRLVVANEPPGGQRYVAVAGAYITVLPPGVTPSNTSFAWGSRPWAMVIFQALPANRFSRLALLAHESFHREQDSLGLSKHDPPNTHLEDEEARRLLRLELLALAAALEERVPAERGHVENALIFRAHRHALFPGADTSEARLELHEGLSEYTGARVALLLMPDSITAVARAVRDVGARPTLVRSFAYGTGPALGLLLDRFAGDGWRDSIRARPLERWDLGALLGAASGARVPTGRRLTSGSAARAARYGGATIAREERERAAERMRRIARYRGKLIEGPVLVLRQNEVNRSFDPNELFPLGDDGVVYPTGTFSAPWGTLTVTGDALLANDFSMLRVAAPASSDATSGPGWSLRLTEGWGMRQSTTRREDYEIVRSGSPSP